MTAIPEPPTVAGCSTCMQPITWLYSARRSCWVAFIPAPDGGPHAITPHTCRTGQDAATWRAVRPGDPPSAAYLAAKAALTHPQERTEGENGDR